MTVLNPPIAVQSRTDSNADDFRGALMAGMVSAGPGATLTKPRGGVIPGWGNELSVAQQAAPNMSVLVGEGVVTIPAPTNGHGGWYVINDAALTVTISASNATNPRTDLIIARVGDPQYYTGGDGLASIKVITGTAGSGAPVPTVPVADGAYVVLARVAVAATVTTITSANITLNTNTSRPYTVAVGGILPVANAAARTALVPFEGMTVHQIDTKEQWIYAGGAWQGNGGAGAWTVYSPTLRSYTTAPSGNYVIDARYKQMGKHIDIDVSITGGTTATWGTGGGGIVGLLPVAQRRAFGHMLFTVEIVTSGTPDVSNYYASPSSTWHDVASSGSGITGAFPATTIYLIRATYEAA